MKKRSLVKYGGGGTKKPEPKRAPIAVTDPNDPRLRAYNDSNEMYNDAEFNKNVFLNVKAPKTNTYVKHNINPNDQLKKFNTSYIDRIHDNEFQKTNGYMAQIPMPAVRYDDLLKKFVPDVNLKKIKGKVGKSFWERRDDKNNYDFINLPIGDNIINFPKAQSNYGVGEYNTHRNVNSRNGETIYDSGTIVDKDTRREKSIKFTNYFAVPQYQKPVQPYVYQKPEEVIVKKSTVKPTVKTTSKPKPQIAIQQPIVNNAPIIQQPVVTPTVPTYNTPQQMYQGREFMETTGLQPGNYHPEEVQAALANQTAKGKRAFANGGMVQYPDGGKVRSINDFNKKYKTNYKDKYEFTGVNDKETVDFFKEIAQAEPAKEYALYKEHLAYGKPKVTKETNPLPIWSKGAASYNSFNNKIYLHNKKVSGGNSTDRANFQLDKNINNYIAELAHSAQNNSTQGLIKNYATKDIPQWVKNKYYDVTIPDKYPSDYTDEEFKNKYVSTPYDVEGNMEHQAHHIIEPFIKKDYMKKMQEYYDKKSFANGGTIHIKPENKGKFTATKKATGKSTEELTHSKNPVTRKRAIFAQNAAKWHHADGGILGETTTAIPSRTLRKFAPGGTTLPEGNWAGVDPTTGKPTQTNFNNSTAGSNISTGASIAGAVVPMITSMIPDQTVRDSEGNSVGQKVGTGKAIASSAASGAAMGASFGGPVGALAGAGIGAIYGGISNSMANNKVDAEMKQANDRIFNRKLNNRMSTNNNAFATQDYNNNDMIYAAGGMVVDEDMNNPNAELELNETFQEPSGQVGMVDGPSHDNGGVEVNLEEGTRIWSDRLKHNGKTFAALTRPIVNKIEKLEKTSPTDYNSRFKQNSKMLLNKQLDHLFEVQETNKQQDEMKRSLKNNAVVNDRGNYHYAMGGMLPRYAEAGTFGETDGDPNNPIYSNTPADTRRFLGLPNKNFLKSNFFGYRPNTTAVAPAVIPPVVNNKRNRSVKPNAYTLPAGAPVRRSFNFNPNLDLPDNYIGPHTEEEMLRKNKAGMAWLNNLSNRFEGDPLGSTREWLNKKTVDFTAHPENNVEEITPQIPNWFEQNKNTMGQLGTLGTTLVAENANINKMPAPRSIGNVNFQNQIVNPKYMDLSAERAAINRANMGAMDESQRQFGNSATAQAFKNKARLNQLEGLGKSYQTQENTNASIYNQFAGMQGEAGIKQAMANTDIDRQNAENWYGDKVMRLSNKNAAIATAGHGVGEVFGNKAKYENDLEKANILSNQQEGTVLADTFKNDPVMLAKLLKARRITQADYNRVTGNLTPEIVPPTLPPTPPTIPPPTTTPPQIGPPQKAYGGTIKRRTLRY